MESVSCRAPNERSEGSAHLDGNGGGGPPDRRAVVQQQLVEALHVGRRHLVPGQQHGQQLEPGHGYGGVLVVGQLEESVLEPSGQLLQLP